MKSCHVVVKFSSITKHVHLYIVLDILKPILGVGDAVALKLTCFHCPIYNSWHSSHDLGGSIDSIQKTVNASSPAFTTDLLNPSYAKLFSGIRWFHCQPVHITMKESSTPVQKPACKVPLAMRDQFKAELDRMEAQGIISKYDGPEKSPEWLNSFVIVKKPSGALDPTGVNKEIVQPVCNARTIDDVLDKLKNANILQFLTQARDSSM